MNEATGALLGDEIEFRRRSDKRFRDLSEVRGRDVLGKLVKADPRNEAELREAHSCLTGDPNYASAMHMAASSLRLGKIRVFISYRLGVDADLARALAEAIRELSVGRVSVTLAADFTRDNSGQNYKEVIEKEIARAHWFVLLLPDSEDNSEWCMYETGMFRASMVSTRVNRLICIHHPKAELPAPIADFQSVASECNALIDLFTGLFHDPQQMPGWSAINARITRKMVLKHAEEIVRQMRGPSQPVSLHYSVEIEILRPSEITTAVPELAAELLAGYNVRTDTKTADLFGKVEPPATWGELIDNVRRGGRYDKWLIELVAVIQKICQNNTFRPISATFEASHGGRVMRPVLESMHYEAGGDRRRVRLIFLEDLYAAPVQEITPEVLAFLTALRTNSRLRWELIERFAGVNWGKDKEKVDACAGIFSRIERIGQPFTQWDLEALCANYPEHDRDSIRNIVVRWRELRRPGDEARRAGPGELDLAFNNYRFAKIGPLIDECAKLVNDFMGLSFPVMEALNVHGVGGHIVRGS